MPRMREQLRGFGCKNEVTLLQSCLGLARILAKKGHMVKDSARDTVVSSEIVKSLFARPRDQIKTKTPGKYINALATRELIIIKAFQQKWFDATNEGLS
jgi:hypothetical protein